MSFENENESNNNNSNTEHDTIDDDDEEDNKYGDYYALLNLPRDFTDEELKQSYKRLCIMYHPDKHTTEESKKKAEMIFNKIKHAYLILSDPQKKALFDIYGEKGVSSGLEITTYSNTYQEIKAEYERAKRAREEQRKLQRTNPKGTVSVSIDATSLFDPYYNSSQSVDVHPSQKNKRKSSTSDDYDRYSKQQQQQQQRAKINGGSSSSSSRNNRSSNNDEDELYRQQEEDLTDIVEPPTAFTFSFPDIAISALSIAQSIEAPLSDNDLLTFSGQLSAKNGMGGGNVTTSYRRQIDSASWGEVELSAGNGGVISVRGLRNINKYSYFTGGITFQQMTRGGFAKVYSGTLAHKLGENTMGYLTICGGANSFVNTSISKNTENTSTVVTAQIGIPHTYIGLTHVYKVSDTTKLRVASKIGTVGIFVEYGGDRQISNYSKLSVSLTVGIPAGVVLKAKLIRANQQYVFPLTLSHEIAFWPVVLGTVIPSAAYLAIRQFIILPYRKREEKAKLEKLRRENTERVQTQKREAEAAILLMKESVERKVNVERDRLGLIIVQGLYGNIKEYNTDPVKYANLVIDVTIPLQSLVKDSRLQLQNYSKAGLVGFYDPCIGEPKQLYIKYLFQESLHEVTFNDDALVGIPKPSHKIPIRKEQTKQN